LTLSFQPQYWPAVDSPSNRNEYQEHLLGGKGGCCLRLTTLPPSCADGLEIWKPQPPRNLRKSSGLYRDYITTYYSNELDGGLGPHGQDEKWGSSKE